MNTPENFAKTLNWEIEMKPIIENDGPPWETPMFIKRSDSNIVLGTMSCKYKPFYNSMFVELCQAIQNQGPFVMEGFMEYFGGSRVAAFIRFNSSKVVQEHTENENRNLLFGDSIPTKQHFDKDEYLVICNHHTGKNSLILFTTSILTRCSNVFHNSLTDFRLPHQPYVNFESTLVKLILSNYGHQRIDDQSRMKRWFEIPVNIRDIEDLIVHILDWGGKTNTLQQKRELLESKRGKLLKSFIDLEMNDLGRNIYGLWNGVTRYTSHHLDKSAGIAAGFSGPSQKINKRAFHFCTQIEVKNTGALKENRKYKDNLYLGENIKAKYAKL